MSTDNEMPSLFAVRCEINIEVVFRCPDGYGRASFSRCEDLPAPPVCGQIIMTSEVPWTCPSEFTITEVAYDLDDPGIVNVSTRERSISKPIRIAIAEWPERQRQEDARRAADVAAGRPAHYGVMAPPPLCRGTFADIIQDMVMHDWRLSWEASWFPKGGSREQISVELPDYDEDFDDFADEDDEAVIPPPAALPQPTAEEVRRRRREERQRRIDLDGGSE